MKNNKIIRTICFFTDSPSKESIQKVNDIASILAKKGFLVQTKRICSPSINKVIELDSSNSNNDYVFGLGSLEENKLLSLFNNLSANIFFNLDLTKKEITIKDAKLLFEIIKRNPARTFNFAYVFNNPTSSPFLPSGNYSQNGFSIGLQLTDLSENCQSIEKWLDKIKEILIEIYELFKDNPEFLGIDSSIAPFFSGKSSLVGLIKKLGLDFSHSATTDTYLKITKFIKKENPKPVGLCGIMFPCLEDFELADEYENGNFSIERNIYLSLHSGLGIDTYPIGINEKEERILEILKLLQELSNKYQKPLSARFVSDGRAKIGEKTNFKNQYLKDVVVKNL